MQRDLVKQVTHELASTGGVGSTIVYVCTRKETEEVANFLQLVCVLVVVCVSLVVRVSVVVRVCVRVCRL